MPTYSTTSIVNAAPMTVNTAFPSANNTVNTAELDTSLATASRVIVTMGLQVSWSNLANHTDNTKIITFTLQDSNVSNANFANVNPLITVRLAGVTTNGAAADQYRIPLPRHLQRYTRLSVSVPSSGPDLTALNFGMSLVTA